MGRQRKRGIDTMKGCLKKSGLMSGKKGKWCRVAVLGGRAEEECMEFSPGEEPLTLTRCHYFI